VYLYSALELVDQAVYIELVAGTLNAEAEAEAEASDGLIITLLPPESNMPYKLAVVAVFNLILVIMALKQGKMGETLFSKTQAVLLYCKLTVGLVD
jgi:hypothetical protein